MKLQQKQLSIGEITKYTDQTEVHDFINTLYKEIPAGELEQLTTQYLYEAAYSAFELLKAPYKGSNIKIFSTPSNPNHIVVEVLSKDIAFIVDSVGNELKKHGCEILFVAHPTFWVERNHKGEFIKIERSKEAKKEVLVQFHIVNLHDDKQLGHIVERLYSVVECVHFTVSDWANMRNKMEKAAQVVQENTRITDLAEKDELVRFLDWLIGSNFVFLGSYICRIDAGSTHLEHESKLGILKSDLYSIEGADTDIQASDDILFIRKWDDKSVVHRTDYMDRVVVKHFDAQGRLEYALIFLGFFTSSVYYQSVRDIPFIRKKINNVINRYGHSETSHNGKVLIAAIEAFPRGELLQMSEDELYDTAKGIVSLSLMPRVKLFVRRDKADKFISCLLFIPKARFSTYIREVIERTICKRLNATIARQYVQIGDGQLVRVQLIVKTIPNNIPDFSIQDIENDIINIISSWEDNLLQHLNNKLDQKEATIKFKKYKEAFDIKYKSTFTSKQAVHDIKQLEECLENGDIKAEIYQPGSSADELIGCKIYSYGQGLELSSLLPTIESLGFFAKDVLNFKVHINGADSGDEAYVHYFRLQPANKSIKINPNIKNNIESALEQIWKGNIDDDKFNSLILCANITWRETIIFRIYAKYLKQIKFAYSNEIIVEALIKNEQLTGALADLFNHKFNPQFSEEQRNLENIKEKIISHLQDISDVTEDKIFRTYLNLLDATVRTNYFQLSSDGGPKSYISLKILSHYVDSMPLPKPFAEIFVYSTAIEAIHLRGEKVARGGLRWSDRKEDYRTEVLGLMKTQIPKNCIIVPSGSKGGFIVKNKADTPEESRRNAVEAYRTFLSGMLDITDNVIEGEYIVPDRVIRHDEDDSYLVVAADKGTATFSDYANEVSKNYNFWLGDAFASGGSSGYDHKAMGITARGAWISVERHFKELGMNIYQDPFTTVGIGDMSGDVFGNGMLSSRNIKLVAAFNHMHIFVDPDPDPEAGYRERQRLFKLPGSKWSDYNRALMSKGGGVFERSAKAITLSAEIKRLLGLNIDKISPDELIQAILKAPVDLLWNGGIGTYIKASHESNIEVGDKSNDRLRVDGKNVRSKIIGEGGNLGMTQLGRMEYARQGGRLNTDFIDNSAGVDCSDHEVNIKIAFNAARKRGELDIKNRDKLLSAMSDDVAELVLKDNYMQTQIISIEENSLNRSIEEHAWLIKQLESTGELDRSVEKLPTNNEIAALKSDKKKLSRPSIAILVAYSTNSVAKHLTGVRFLQEDQCFTSYLADYFPEKMRSDYYDDIIQHQLGNEIICMAIANEFVNRLGCCIFHQLLDVGWKPFDIVKAFVFVHEVFGIHEIWRSVELDDTLDGTTQIAIFSELQIFLERNIIWALHSGVCANTDILSTAESYKTKVAILQEAYESDKLNYDEGSSKAESDRFLNWNVREKLLSQLIKLKILTPALDIIYIAQTTNTDITDVANTYYELSEKMHLNWMLNQAKHHFSLSYINRLATRAIMTDINDVRVTLTIMEINARQGKVPEKGVYACIKDQQKLQNYYNFIEEVKSANFSDIIATLVIALKIVRELI